MTYIKPRSLEGEFTEIPAPDYTKPYAFMNVTKSRRAARLMELEDAGNPFSVIEPHNGRDPYHRFAALRRTLGRCGYRLHIKIEQAHNNRIVLWATKDPSLNRALFICKPRSRPRPPRFVDAPSKT